MSSKVIVTIFGASGDLAKRKLYPSLLDSINQEIYLKTLRLSEQPADHGARNTLNQSVVESITDLADSPQQAQEFASHFYYQSHDVNDTEHYIALRELQNSLDENTKRNTTRSSSCLWLLNFWNHCQTPKIRRDCRWTRF